MMRGAGLFLFGSALALLACSNAPPSTPEGEAGAPGESEPMGSAGHEPGTDGTSAETTYRAQVSVSASPSIVSGGSPGGGGSGGPTIPAVSGPPYGESTTCGDGIVGFGLDEECDDGAGGAMDGCTDTCQTRDFAVGEQPSVGQASIDRYLGAGRHPLAGSEEGIINVRVNVTDDAPVVEATVFNIWGQPAHYVDVSVGASPLQQANPVAAALPGGAYAAAWSDMDADGSDLGVALRAVAVDGTVGPLQTANAATEFSQLNPDMIWTGSELVVAWEDYANAETGPDLKYRKFGADLRPTSGEIALAAGPLPEAAVALAPFAGGWAAAYREGAPDGSETIVIRAADASYRVGPIWGGPLDDRPALAALDEAHLVVVFSAGTSPANEAPYNTPRLRYAVIDTQSQDGPTIESLDPRDNVTLLEPQTAQLSPAIARAFPGVFVAWRSEARPGDAAGDQIWLKRFGWRPDQQPSLKARDVEMLIPRSCEGNFGDQRAPALARTDLPPSGALAMAWEDYAHAKGARGEPDVLMQYAPTPEGSLDDGMLYEEHWTTTPNGALASNWASSVVGTSVVSISGNQLQVSGPSAAYVWPTDINPLNVDVTVKTQWNLNGARSSIFARRDDAEPGIYVHALFGTLVNDTWVIEWVKNGVVTRLASAVQPVGFTNYAQKVDYYMRFRVETKLDQSVFVGAKLWEAGVPEPQLWTMQATLAASSPAAISIAQRSGRVGVIGLEAQGGRNSTFDDFVVRHFDEGYAGLFDHEIHASRPLTRLKPAESRPCRSGEACAGFSGCCEVNGDCSAGLSCVRGLGPLAELGSDARICMSNHCTDRVSNYGEVRADCGGPDCAPCSCTSTALPGASNYCTATCPCGIGETSCDDNTECLFPLICRANQAVKYGWPSGNACIPSHCINRTLETALGETDIDCGGECGDCFISTVNGGPLHCEPWHKCPHGEGYCSLDDACQTGTKCGSTLTGPRFGLVAGGRACVKPHCDNGVYEPALGETAKDCGGECGNCP